MPSDLTESDNAYESLSVLRSALTPHTHRRTAIALRASQSPQRMLSGMRQQSEPSSPSESLSGPLAGMLSDRQLSQLGPRLLSPWNPEHLQPASIDLTLGDEFIVFSSGEPVDLESAESSTASRTYAYAHSPFVLPPLTFALARTVESVHLRPVYAARVEGRSSVGRKGLLVHATAGFIDPGFSGTITLELFNLRSAPLLLRPGIRIAQLSVFALTEPSERPYGSNGLGSKYQGQYDAQTSLGTSDAHGRA